MPSDRQLAANKKNAQKSTGPKTPEGRAAVRLNGVKHGLTAKTLVLPGESESDFESLLDSFEAEHRPATPTEEALVRQMTMAQWRLRRLYQVEAGFFRLALIDAAEDAEDKYESLDDAGRLAYIVERDSGSSSTRENLSRIEARLERSFYKALRELQRLHADRPKKMENQTQSCEAGDSPARKNTPDATLPPGNSEPNRAENRPFLVQRSATAPEKPDQPPETSKIVP